jgi:hypothetical protein
MSDIYEIYVNLWFSLIWIIAALSPFKVTV